MTRILATHTTPIPDIGVLGNSYEELGWLTRRGFGVSLPLYFTKDHGLTFAATDTLSSLPESSEVRRISEMSLAELRRVTFGAQQHLPTFNEFVSVFRGFVKAKYSEHSFLVIQLGSTEDPALLDALLAKATWIYPQTTLLVASETAARYIRQRNQMLSLAYRLPSNASMDAARLKQLRALYSWVWIEDGDPSEPATGLSLVCQLKTAGFSIGMETSGATESLQRAIACRPDVLASDNPWHAQELVNHAWTRMERWMMAWQRFRASCSRFRIRHALSTWKNALLLKLLDVIETHTGSLITFHRRPMYARGVTDVCDPLVTYPSYAIVLQGGLLRTHDFTLETVRMYKQLFPQAHIIVSTWEGEDPAYVKAIQDEQVTVLLNKKPAYNGPFNINYQITSSIRGVEHANILGAEYVLKTRTDQRIYNKNAFETMTNLLRYFPPSERSKQKKRLLFVHGGNKYQPYHLPDVFVFGATEDMVEYWEPVLVDANAPYANFLPEVYLASRFLKKKGWNLDWTTESMWSIHRECLIALDWADVELYWYKYDRYHEHMDRKSYMARLPVYDHLSFFEWFNIYSNLENKRLLPDHALFFREFPPRPQYPSV